MTAEGYDYEYALTTSMHDEWGYGSYSSTTSTFTIEVTVDPPACLCSAKGTDKINEQVDDYTPGPRHDRPQVG